MYNIKKWEPDNFKLEETTYWTFPIYADWATHNSNYRGNCSPYVVRNIILKYSNEKDWILDQFIGGGTTAVEAKLLNRNIIGVDINNTALKISKEKTTFKYNLSKSSVYLKNADARDLNFIKNNSIDLICTHPPYANIIQYSNTLENDLSKLDISNFLISMEKVASESFRVLKENKFCAILIGDIRKKGVIIPLAFNIINIFQEKGFKIKEIIIKQQHNCKSNKYWQKNKLNRDFLLIAHEYLIIFKK